MPYMGSFPGCGGPCSVGTSVEPSVLIATISTLIAVPSMVGYAVVKRRERKRAERHMALVVDTPGHFDYRCGECIHFLGIEGDRHNIAHIYRFSTKARRENVRQALARAYAHGSSIEFIHQVISKEFGGDKLEVLQEPGEQHQVVAAYQAQ